MSDENLGLRGKLKALWGVFLTENGSQEK